MRPQDRLQEFRVRLRRKELLVGGTPSPEFIMIVRAENAEHAAKEANRLIEHFRDEVAVLDIAPVGA